MPASSLKIASLVTEVVLCNPGPHKNVVVEFFPITTSLNLLPWPQYLWESSRQLPEPLRTIAKAVDFLISSKGRN